MEFASISYANSLPPPLPRLPFDLISRIIKESTLATKADHQEGMKHTLGLIKHYGALFRIEKHPYAVNFHDDLNWRLECMCEEADENDDFGGNVYPPFAALPWGTRLSGDKPQKHDPRPYIRHFVVEDDDASVAWW